ncbi:hypothetical protein [Amycolatopsis sp. MEPSY49]|uniref:hypothetical protein n=1 Tax=Amycolatopsis sp. MEPSY49 TaxID=3151600 RepID=UPI003EF77A1D
MLDHTNPGRVHHDEAHPSWAAVEGVLLRGSVPAGREPHQWRREPRPRTGHSSWTDEGSARRAIYRATGFTKPAAALPVGDYLRIHRDRWPEVDQDVDEGFARIEDLRLLDSDVARQLFAAAGWDTTVVVATLYALPGVVLLRSEHLVEVQAQPNAERNAWEFRNPWNPEPPMEFCDSRSRTEAERRAAETVDAACRPQIEEQDWYPSRYRDPFKRRLALESRHGVRMVPLSALPWPHNQSNCRLGPLAGTLRTAVIDAQTAHAAAFLSQDGRTAMESCRYHQPDWPRLVGILVDILGSAGAGEPQPRQHPDYRRLSAEDQQWLGSLLEEPIDWDDRDQSLTNGQHRVCALRAARVQPCPVRGNYLLDTDYGSAIPATKQAKNAIRASWRRYASERGWPRWVGTLIGKLPPAMQTRISMEY